MVQNFLDTLGNRMNGRSNYAVELRRTRFNRTANKLIVTIVAFNHLLVLFEHGMGGTPRRAERQIFNIVVA